MSEEVQGEGSAYDAGVSVDLPAEPAADAVAEAERVVEATKRKVEKQKEHLAGAEAALATAEAALAALNGGAA